MIIYFFFGAGTAAANPTATRAFYFFADPFFCTSFFIAPIM